MISFDIRPGVATDGEWIQRLSRLIRRPTRIETRWRDYLVAEVDGEAIGCAAVERIDSGGYLYGLSVHPEHRRRGVGSALTLARVEKVRRWDGEFAVALAMFWNLRFFRRLGFNNVPKSTLPEAVIRLPDFRSSKLRRSTAILRLLQRP